MYIRPPLYILVYLIYSSFIIVNGKKNVTENSCEPLMFDCGDNNCIPRSWRCDGDTDCLNGNDEKGCPPSYTCNDDQYRCKDSKPSDEIKLRWRSTYNLFSPKCIPKKWVCDGAADCMEGDDEENCKDITCTEGQFKCHDYAHNSPSCIPESWVCDGQQDCKDGLDEKNCTNIDITEHKKCKDDEFQCDNGQCIFKTWKCDQEFDCLDKSDEKYCEEVKCDPETHFQCTNTSFCLPINWKCDLQPDCPDHSDEKDCPPIKHDKEVKCNDDEFMCLNKAQCIRKVFKCDNDEDCSDGSDELNCDIKEQKCGVDEELCDDGICRLDCNPIKTCDKNNNFMCDNGTCISYYDLCKDDKPYNDCQKSVCKNVIKQCDDDASRFCQCRQTYLNGTVCYCPKGFELINNQCVDIDECKIPGICDQRCTNLIGTYKCDCYPGFQLTGGIIESDGIKKLSKCRAIGSDPLLLLSNRATIRQYDLSTNRYHPMVNKLDSAVAMDYWHSKRMLIWSDVSQEKILSCTLKENDMNNMNECQDDVKVLIDKNISTPDGLAIDWVHGLLFWTDTGLDTINVYDFNTNKRKILFDTDLEEPRAIAVDPAAGLIFWTDWGSKGKIERAGMDGNNRVEILNGNEVRWPNGLAVDIYDRRLYWADAKTKTISSCNYWGGEIRRVLNGHEKLKHPFSLTIFEERVYWTDWDAEGVLSVNKFNGDEFKIITHSISGPMTVRIYHEVAQPNQTNKCEKHTCEHICLPRALIREANKEHEGMLQGLPYKCVCEMGYRPGLQDMTACIGENLLGGAVVNEFNHVTENTGSGLFTITVLALIVAAAMLIGYVYRQRRFNRFNALNFDNPIYRRTVEDIDGELEVFGDNTLGAIPTNPGNQEPRLVLSNNAASEYNRATAPPPYMDNDPINHRSLY